MDQYGNQTINILGDSISHGANTNCIPEDSYAGRIKKFVAQKQQSLNYGYTSMLYELENGYGIYQEIHTIEILSGTWREICNGEYPGLYSYVSGRNAGTLGIQIDGAKYEAAKHIRGMFIYYKSSPEMGSFQVREGESVIAKINSQTERTDNFARTAYIPVSFNEADKLNFTIEKEEGAPVLITGISYVENPDEVIVQNYSRNGAQLNEISKEVLDFVCHTDQLILAIGHNDARVFGNQKTFHEKIENIIYSCKKWGTKVIILDTIWEQDAKKEYYRKEIKRIAEELNGIYISFVKEVKENPEMIQDGSHPTKEGHQIIAEEICRYLFL